MAMDTRIAIMHNKNAAQGWRLVDTLRVASPMTHRRFVLASWREVPTSNVAHSSMLNDIDHPCWC
jgi:hypothetical protein